MPKKALVVDNDFFFVEFLKDLLQKRGYEVVKAYDGKEGLSKLGEGAVDIVFVDMVMPKIDGNQMIKVIRHRFPDAPFPIVAVSGTFLEQMDQIDTTGADFFIVKGPLEQMSAHVESFMDRVERNGFSPEEADRFIEPGEMYPRQTTSELMEDLNYQRFVLESVGVGIVIVDKDARIISVNPMALELAGCSFEEVLSTPVTSMFPGSQKPHLIGALKAVAQDPSLKSTSVEMTVVARRLRAIVSLLRMEANIGGWVIVLVENEG